MSIFSNSDVFDPTSDAPDTTGTQNYLAGGSNPQGSASGVIRDQPEPATESRAALVKSIMADINDGKRVMAPVFKRMRQDMDFAAGKQYQDQGEDDDRYLVNLAQRHVQERVAALYAKNPTVVAKRVPRLDFAIWDGTFEEAQQAMQAAEQALRTLQAPVPGQAQAPPASPYPGAIGAAAAGPAAAAAPQFLQMSMQLQSDITQGVQKRKMLDNVGKTLEMLFKYYMRQQDPDFKAQMKQMVVRAITAGVGYIKPGYQRIMEKRPETVAQIDDIVDRLAKIQQMAADQADGITDDNDADVEDLRLTLAQLQSEPMMIVREGPTWDFPQSTRVIYDPQTKCIQGWVGTDWIAEEFLMTREQVQQIYEVDIGTSYASYNANTKAMYQAEPISSPGQSSSFSRVKGQKFACVYQFYRKSTGLLYVVCDGYPDFLAEPAAPDFQIKGFFPYIPLILNKQEHETEVMPPSNIRLIRHIQKEYNRSREAKRQHRIANRPLYVAGDGALEEDDSKNLAHAGAHDVITVAGLQVGQKASDLIQPLGKIGVDPNMYDVSELYSDFERVTGSQAANLGGTSGATATESSIAEGSRVSSLQSNADDLDEMLSTLASMTSQIMFAELSAPTVKQIVGPGAVWPTLTAEDIAEQVFLDIKAGSSGRPNAAQMLANIERAAPFLVQIPGLNPAWLANLYIQNLDPQIDIEDAIIDGLPSIVQQNGMQQPGTGNPATSPEAQGPQGAANAPVPPQTPGGPQPGMPAPDGALTPQVQDRLNMVAKGTA